MRRLDDLGGRLLHGDAATLRRDGAGWAVQTRDGAITADDVVVALGPWSDTLLRRLGYRLPLFVKRGYHRHFACEQPPSMPLLDMANGVMMAPMSRGLRVTTGAELALLDAPPTPVQLDRAVRHASELLPIEAATNDPVRTGARPCTTDMLPVVGPASRHIRLWFNFGHGHQELTLCPVTGRLIAEMIAGHPPFVDADAYLPHRFLRPSAVAATLLS